MSGKAGFVYSPAIERYNFGPEHPFNSKRLKLTIDLLQRIGILFREDYLSPQPATEEDLLLIHDKAYLEVVERLSEKTDEVSFEHGLGTEDNPVFKGMHQATALVVGGTILAAKSVIEGNLDHAVNLAGGLHHALRNRAAGFCIYNDAAVAIAYLQRNYGARVAYIDIDAHHGDGVQAAFYDDPNVLTISFHETGRYLFPGTGFVHERGTGAGFGYNINVPLEAFTEDDSWVKAFAAVVPVLVESFRPDIIVTTNGCDTHALDPMTHLNCTTRAFNIAQILVHKLAHRVCKGRLVAVGGGGYDWYRVVPRAWSLLWSVISHRSLPEELPKSWAQRWEKEAGVKLPSLFLDELDQFPPVPRRPEIEERNHMTVQRVLSQATYGLNKFL